MSWPRNVLITGAGSGLGLALAATLVARGSTVLGLVRRPESATALLAATADRAIAVQGDVTEPAVEDAIAAALARHRKPLDLLVNNAGAMAVGNTLSDLDPAEIVRLIDLHCNGALRCTRAALPALRLAERAMVVNVSSGLASLARVSAGEFDALRISYAMRISKAALNMATVCLARELLLTGSRCTASILGVSGPDGQRRCRHHRRRSGAGAVAPARFIPRYRYWGVLGCKRPAAALVAASPGTGRCACPG